MTGSPAPCNDRLADTSSYRMRHVFWNGTLNSATDRACLRVPGPWGRQEETSAAVRAHQISVLEPSIRARNGQNFERVSS
jgi:hypothetical protein